MKDILLRKSDELNKATRTYFEYLKAWLKSEEKESFTLKEARTVLNTSHGSQKRYMSILIDNYFIKKEKTKEGFVYSVNSYEDYKQLKNKVSNTLDEILLNLKNNEVKNLVTKQSAVHSSSMVQAANEPVKAKPVKKSRTKIVVVQQNNNDTEQK
jgi:hypothetical protein